MIKYITRRVLIAWLRLKTRSNISYSAYINNNTKLEGFNAIHARAVVSNSDIGFATFIGSECSLPSAKIGRYCSIAHSVEVITHTHPSSVFVSTHPSFYSTLKQSGFTYANVQDFTESLSVDNEGKYSVEIGNDVWIGARVTIMGGVKIGHGVIIGAGAVVTKDILPYQIVGGVPAKFIRNRFSYIETDFLLNFKWWDKDFIWLKNNYKSFSSVKFFIKNHFNS